jgi:serine/threonine protein kinase SCH9
VDFWSLGVLLFEMCCGWSPFYAEDTQQMYKNICFGKIRFPKGVINEDGKMFVKGLLNRNPKHRLGAERDAAELKEHAFFKDVDWNALAKKQITPPFKPNVESDESTNNFDPEFTESDIGSLVSGFGMDDLDGGEWLDETDPSEEWVAGSLSGNADKGHIHHGPLGSDKEAGKKSLSRSSSRNGSKKLSLSRQSSGNSGRGGGIAITKSNPKRTTSGTESVLSHSMQENFKGFTFSGGESVGALTGRGGASSGNISGAESGEDATTDDDDDIGRSAGRYANTRRKGFGFTEIGD